MGFLHILVIICVFSFNSFAISANDLETYIVHVELPDNQLSSASSNNEDLESWYRSFLPTTIASSNQASPMVYSYHNIFKGFAAKLSPEQVKEMEKKPGFVSARPQETLSLLTTHTPNFLGLNQNMGFWNQSSYGKGIVIGILDTGIMPDHPSFNDEGMPPPPAKWKGICQFNSSLCNNKLIGARYFRDEGNGTAIDENGHGTHVASTAAGNYVRGANVFGNANGTAVGIAPLAHLASCKVCNSGGGCSESDILAAMDVAIDDGVDILSLSLQFGSNPFYSDNIALGAYSAIEKGIFVSCAAGNSGPRYGTLSNEAPWILTVGASTIDRKIKVTAMLGNREEFDGESLNQPKYFPSASFPLIFPGVNESDYGARYCFSSSLENNTEIRGKIVVCEDAGGASGRAVKDAGGIGMILFNGEEPGYTIQVDAQDVPAMRVGHAGGLKIIAYINSTKSAMASISFKGTVIGDNHAPAVAWFSSRGPSRASRGILKPDIVGPGVNILAAWPNSVDDNTNTKSTFNIISGTSMACPHLSGVAALLKSVHPNWSTAAIKSSIMTTADVVNLGNNPIEDERLLPADVFATGSGHVNPVRASNPGLIYDIEPKEYIPYLCGLNYTNRQVGFFVQRKVNCLEESSIAEAQLNYPSFSIEFGSAVQTYTRTVINVGEANESYTVEIVPPEGVNVTVKPNTLNFAELNQKLTYEVTFSLLENALNRNISQGFLTWKSAKHSVRSPIAAISDGRWF